MMIKALGLLQHSCLKKWKESSCCRQVRGSVRPSHPLWTSPGKKEKWEWG